MGKVRKPFTPAPASYSEEDDSDQEDGDINDDSTNETSESETLVEQEKSDDGSSSDTESKNVKFKKLPKRELPTVSENNPFKKQKIESNLYKPPTVEEIHQLRETENLFHSNLFRLQIKEMLEEIKIKEKYKNFIKTWLDELNDFLKNLDSMQEKEDLDKIKWLKKSRVHVPIIFDQLKLKPFQFQFLKPNQNAFLIGSAMNGSMIGPNLIVDVCILMPAKSFQKENYLNLAYDQKRALYLTALVAKMEENKFSCADMRFNYFRNNLYKPILEIVPNGIMAKKLRFQIFVAGETDSFKISRFVPWNSNIRESIFCSTNGSPDDELVYATPCYNASLLFDLVMERNQNLIGSILCSQKNLQEGLVLLKIWLKQRGLDHGYSGFGAHIMTMFVVYLYKERKLLPSMSSYQIARNVWNNLAISNWHEDGKGISLCSELSTPNLPTLEQFHAYYDVVFIDSTGFMNICANLSLDVYLKIKSESERAVELLNNKTINSFQSLFMIKIPIYNKFDHILKLCDKNTIEKVLQTHGTKADRNNFAGYWYPHLLKIISSVLRKGLGQRILSLTPIENTTISWSVKDKPIAQPKFFILGLVLNPEKAYEILDKGPQANEDTAAAFREFWGEMSQLRRFKDGSITEACVWSTASATFSQKRLIAKRIIIHLLQHHFQIDESNVTYMADEFDVSYQLNQTLFLFADGIKDAESTTLDVIKTFDNIGKKLRSLDNLPLDIHSIQGISSVFRYCDPVPILGQGKTYKKEKKTIFQAYTISEGVIQLGTSGKWPNDLPAFQRIKTAFHLQIARLMRTQFNLEAVGGIDGIHIIKDGYLYKVEIFHPKEIALMKKEITSKGIVQYNETPESLEMEKRLAVLPKLTSALHGLYQRYPSFGPTVMIAKRWLYSQLLDSFLWPDECTELLIASQYMQIGPLAVASQPQTGFFRFLHLLAYTDWINEIFLLNFNDEMNHDEISDIRNKFNAERDLFPPLFIATAYDSKRDGIWSKHAPSVQVLSRVTLLARHTLEILQPTFTTKQNINVDDLFIASLEGYDVIIQLEPKLIHTSLVHNFGSQSKIDASIPAAGFDPVQRGLQELREAYSDFAIFFYNPCGGNEIAVIWKPDIFEEKEFKVTSVNGCKVTENGHLKCNIPQIIEDFKIILHDLFFKINNISKKYKDRSR